MLLKLAKECIKAADEFEEAKNYVGGNEMNEWKEFNLDEYESEMTSLNTLRIRKRQPKAQSHE